MTPRMQPASWRRLNDLFHAARELPADEVDDYLRRECADDDILLSEVRHMLQADEETSILDHPPTQVPGPVTAFRPDQMLCARFRVVRFLNRGGMGEVYEAYDEDLREPVAIKTLLPEIAADGRMVARFKQEIQLSRRISHPNVCRVYDLYRDGPVVFLAMEFLPGETLSARISRERSLPETMALTLLEQMARALDAAHGAGVLHRDFKPSNVMLVPDHDSVRAVVTDFGLARSLRSSSGTSQTDATQTMSGHVMGTLDYMAPEVLATGETSRASDIYSLGVTVCRMLTGALPFSPDTPLLERIKRPTKLSVRERAPGVSAKWWQPVERSLDPDPTQRFVSASDFAAAIRGEAIPGPKLRITVMRRRILAGATGLALLTLAYAVWQRWSTYAVRPSAEAAAFYRKGVDNIYGGAYYAATKALSEAVRVAPGFSLAHARLAEAWLEMDAADKASREMLLARRDSAARLSELDRLQLDAVDLMVTREFAGAAAKYRRMHEVAPEDAGIELDLGRALEKARKVDDAVATYERVAHGPTHNPAAWLHLAVQYARASKTAKAEEAFRQAEELYQASSNLEGLTETDEQRGIAANSRGQLAIGKAALERALETAKRAGNVQQEISIRLRLSSNAYLSGDAALAERYASEALADARTNQMEVLEHRGIVNLGNAYYGKRDFAGAEKYYQESLRLARRYNSPRLEALSVLSMAALHDQMQKPAEEAAEAQAALTFYQPNRFALETSQALTLLARAQMRRADYDGALAAFRQILSTAEKNGDKLQIVLANESVGHALFALERYPEALEFFEKSRDLSNNSEQQAFAQISEGATLARLGRFAEAAAAFDLAEASKAKFASIVVPLDLSRAEMLLGQGRYSDVKKLSTRLLSGKPSASTESQAYSLLGEAQTGLGELAAGQKNCELAMSLAPRSFNGSLVARAQIAAIRASLRVGDRVGALRIMHSVDARLAALPETRLLLLAFALAAQPENAAQLIAELDTQRSAIKQLFGEQAFAVYSTRREIQEALRPIKNGSLAYQGR